MRRQAAIVLAAILCLTGCGAGEPAAKPTAKTKTSTSQTLPKSQREALKRQAIQTARDLHEWGADSTIDVTTLNRLDAADAAGRLKGFLADTRPDSLSDLTVDESAGPDAASIPCTGDIRGGCQTVPTMRSWMSIEVWAREPGSRPDRPPPCPKRPAACACKARCASWSCRIRTRSLGATGTR